jgi:GDPmannose 4,6-dehydratase
MFGGSESDYPAKEWATIRDLGLDEHSPFHPKSPYAAAKLFAHNLIDIYRKSYGLFAVCGILFNHESHRRDPRFVTRKVTVAVARKAVGSTEKLILLFVVK